MGVVEIYARECSEVEGTGRDRANGRRVPGCQRDASSADSAQIKLLARPLRARSVSTGEEL